MSFWKSGTGVEITGEPSKAFVPEFTIIPNNTSTCAQISLFNLIESKDYEGNKTKYYQITWKIINGDFKGREVIQKIKAFNGTPEQIDRALNMLKLIMDLSGFKPSHSEEPNSNDLIQMQGKVMGIKIREWSMQKSDRSGIIEGNYVAEVHSPKDFVLETGIKLQASEKKQVSLESAFNRAASAKSYSELQDDIPF